jgi:hypothetical protein
MFISPDADGNESAVSISRALGMLRGGLQQQADIISDCVIESIQKIVAEMNQAKRRLCPIPNAYIDDWEH